MVISNVHVILDMLLILLEEHIVLVCCIKPRNKYKLNIYLFTDVNECTTLSPCAQLCNTTSTGWYQCSCRDGYHSDDDGVTCNGGAHCHVSLVMLKPSPQISMSVMKQLSMTLTCVLETLSVRTQRAPMSVCVHLDTL